MDSTPPLPRPPAPSVRLNGWKEIANHLGKSVRSVQRWEKEYGLPIHRVGREGGEIVFALSDELYRWAIESDPGRILDAAPREASPGSSEPVPVPVLAGRRRLGAVWIAVAVGALAVAAWGLLGVAPGPLPTPVTAAVRGSLLVAFGADGAQLWERPLDFLPHQPAYDDERPPGAKPVVVSDLDGDGASEVAVMKMSLRREEHQGLVVFNADGSERFTIAPASTVTFDSTDYAGPWLAYRLFIIEERTGRRSIWAAFTHGQWFPTLLLELDGTGATKRRYWSNGYIETMTVATWQGRSVVIVGGTHNETKGASLAIFERDRVGGSAPAEAEGYRCTSCDAGYPLHFLVFPRHDAARALNGQASVVQTWVDATDQIHLLAAEGRRYPNGEWPYGVFYTVAPDLTATDAEFAVGAPIVHEELRREGLLGHPFNKTRLPDRRLVRRWVKNAFVPRVEPP